MIALDGRAAGIGVKFQFDNQYRVHELFDGKLAKAKAGRLRGMLAGNEIHRKLDRTPIVEQGGGPGPQWMKRPNGPNFIPL